MFIIFSLECIKCVDVIVCFVCVIDKKNGIVDVVWSVGFDSGGGEFKPWLEWKDREILVFFLVILWCP